MAWRKKSLKYLLIGGVDVCPPCQDGVDVAYVQVGKWKYGRQVHRWSFYNYKILKSVNLHSDEHKLVIFHRNGLFPKSRGNKNVAGFKHHFFRQKSKFMEVASTFDDCVVLARWSVFECHLKLNKDEKWQTVNWISSKMWKRRISC